ncbi:unnamed protein product, partial [Scytosiphon promiscuus]
MSKVKATSEGTGPGGRVQQRFLMTGPAGMVKWGEKILRSDVCTRTASRVHEMLAFSALHGAVPLSNFHLLERCGERNRRKNISRSRSNIHYNASVNFTNPILSQMHSGIKNLHGTAAAAAASAAGADVVGRSRPLTFPVRSDDRVGVSVSCLTPRSLVPLSPPRPLAPSVCL